MRNLIFISAQPHDLYFQWQIEVQIVNFRKFGISDKMHIIVWYPKGSRQLSKWREIQAKYPEVKIFMYPDAEPYVNLGLYVSQLRPNALKQHFKKYHQEFRRKQFFYHDSDIIFNYLPDFQALLQDNVIWQSDTTSYLDYDYFVRKEQQGNMPEGTIVNKMAEIGGINPELIACYAKKTGGAQMLLKDVDYTLFEDIETMSLEIRKTFMFGQPDSINTKYFPDENTGVQSWCADMWAINFALWKRGLETNITKDLDFSWATESYESYLKKPIYHNAGASGQEGIFYKGAWIHKNPITSEVEMPAETTASHMYVKAIKEVNLVV